MHSTDRKRSFPPLYPLLLAPAPAVSIAAANLGQFEISDLLLVVAAIELCTLTALVAAWCISWAISRERREQALRYASFGVGILVVWCFYYEPIREALEHLSWRLSRPSVVVAAGAVASALALLTVVRRPALLDRLTTPLTAFSGALLGIAIVRTVTGGASAPDAVRRSALVSSLARPIAVDAKVARLHNSPRRNVYLIITDMHANSAELSRYLNFDNSRFEDSLRTLGFVVPRDMRSNYNETVVSVPSILNFSHVVQLERDLPPGETRFTVPKYLAEHNRTARFLRGQGYQFVFIPSAWFELTRHNNDATRTVHVGSDVGVVAALRRTELRSAVVQSTPIGLFTQPPTGDWRRLDRTVRAIAAVARDTTPTFVFAHILRPHAPFVLDASCRPLPHQIGTTGSVGTAAERGPYLDQLKCVDKELLALVTTILAESPTPPVIVIVGDHGTRFTDPYFYEHPRNVSPDFIRERFGAFGAFYLPAGGDTLFNGRVSLVNVMRNVLVYYFGAQIPRSPDTQYVNGEKLFEFFPVDPTSGRVATSPAKRSVANALPSAGTGGARDF